jgi:cellulose synthase/poly-beta-1,6-N-acetylglucosamine synthase-like glycosyltransferase
MISFVVPAHNEARYLAATLEAIHAAARALGSPYEIVVADDASTDGTGEIAVAGGARVIRVAHRQIAATRNSGARAASGERLIFVDADTHVNAAVVGAAIAAMQRGAVGGSAMVRFPAEAPWWAHVLVKLILALVRAFRLAAGCFLFCTRAAFEQAGGFDERYFGAEEWVLSQALKKVGRFVVLREAVLTSARKVQSRTLAQTLRVLAGVVLRGAGGLRDRKHCGFWYEDRR